MSTAAPLSARIDRAIAALDRRVGAVVDAVLHQEAFQALEAAWRGLSHVVDRVDPGQDTEVVVWSYSRAELEEDFADGVDVTRTRFFAAVYTTEYGQHGGKPYGLLLANWTASAAPLDMALLRQVAAVAAMAHAPVLLAAAPELLRVGAFNELQSMTSPEAVFDGPGAERWTSFRASEDSRYVGVLLPRMVLRVPYRAAAAGGAARFLYDEELAGATSCLWGSPIFAFAVRAAASFARFRSFAGMIGTGDDAAPVLDVHPALGRRHTKPPVEVTLSRRLEQSLSDLGLVPMTSGMDGALRFESAPSVQARRAFGATDGGQAATLSHFLGTRLPYLLLACRFAHYLKVIERERVGGHRSPAEIERDLNDWLSGYVVQTDSPSPSARLKYPLRNARVKVSEVEGSPGIHRMDVSLQPHLRYMRQSFTLQVAGRIDAR